MALDNTATSLSVMSRDNVTMGNGHGHKIDWRIDGEVSIILGGAHASVHLCPSG